MKPYRKKPVVIHAEEYRRGRHLPEGCLYDGVTGELYIETLEGRMIVSPGDFVIRGIKGEYYPCKPDIFEATYEPVE